MTFKYSHDEQERREPKLIFLAHSSSPCTQILAWLSIRFSMLPNLTNQYISYSMAVFSANEIRTFLFAEIQNVKLASWPFCISTNKKNQLSVLSTSGCVTNDRVRLLLFTISWNSLYRDFVYSKGSWHLFTISRNSLYQDSLYQSLGYLGLVWPAVVWSADDIHFSSIFTYTWFGTLYHYWLIHDSGPRHWCYCSKRLLK